MGGRKGDLRLIPERRIRAHVKRFAESRQYEKRLDERFAGQDKARTEGRESYERRIGAAERELRELHTAFLKHLADLPRDYMRREDHIRFETVINAKLDALGSKFELLTDRLPVRT